MSDQIEHLSATEYDTIGKALWELVKQYPRQPDDPTEIAQYDALGSDSSISVSIVGGRYKKHNVLGGFTAEINFYIAYKSFPTTSPDRIDARAFVGRIASWLENAKNLPLLSGNREITKITIRTLPYKDESEEDGSITYAADLVMEYRKNEEW